MFMREFVFVYTFISFVVVWWKPFLRVWSLIVTWNSFLMISDDYTLLCSCWPVECIYQLEECPLSSSAYISNWAVYFLTGLSTLCILDIYFPSDGWLMSSLGLWMCSLCSASCCCCCCLFCLCRRLLSYEPICLCLFVRVCGCTHFNPRNFC